MFKSYKWIAAVCAGAVLASTAAAQGVPPTVPPWSDDFDDTNVYFPGQDPTSPSVKGWENWDLTAQIGGVISNQHVRSTPFSFFNGGNSDVVQKFSVNSGVWNFVAHAYLPGAGSSQQLTKESFFILLNTFNHGGAGPKNWSQEIVLDPINLQARFSSGPNMGTATPIALDTWVEIRTRVDLNTDMATTFINGQQLGTTYQWSQGSSGGGAVAIAAVDLWSNLQNAVINPNPNGGVSYDDLSLLPETSFMKFCTAKTGLACGTPSISASGVPSVSAGSGFTITAGPARSCRNGVTIYGSAQAAPLPFGGGNGVVCFTPIRRAAPMDSGGTPGNNCDGAFTIDFNSFMTNTWVNGGCNPNIGPQTNPAGFLTAGTTVFAQVWGRDSVATGSFVSDGVSFMLNP